MTPVFTGCRTGGRQQGHGKLRTCGRLTRPVSAQPGAI